MCSLPLLMDDLVGEILLHLPPDDPASLARAAAVCKPWRSLIRSAAFLRRYREFHRTLPMLGFFHNVRDENGDSLLPLFVSTSSACATQSIPLDLDQWCAHDSRHGRVLFENHQRTDLVVWDPITGDQWGLRAPFDEDRTCWTAGVLCAAGGCDHLDCHGGPFSVACVVTNYNGNKRLTTCVYSSVTNAWSEGPFLEHHSAFPSIGSSALVGDILYFICLHSYLLKYDLGGQELGVIEAPLELLGRLLYGAVLLVEEGGGLGFAHVRGSSIRIWSREDDANGVGQWSRHRVIDIEKILVFPVGALSSFPYADLIGFAEGIGVIFVGTDFGVFTVELKSGRMKKISSDGSNGSVIPYMSFYTPDKGRMLQFSK